MPRFVLPTALQQHSLQSKIRQATKGVPILETLAQAAFPSNPVEAAQDLAGPFAMMGRMGGKFAGRMAGAIVPVKNKTELFKKISNEGTLKGVFFGDEGKLIVAPAGEFLHFDIREMADLSLGKKLNPGTPLEIKIRNGKIVADTYGKELTQETIKNRGLERWIR